MAAFTPPFLLKQFKVMAKAKTPKEKADAALAAKKGKENKKLLETQKKHAKKVIDSQKKVKKLIADNEKAKKVKLRALSMLTGDYGLPFSIGQEFEINEKQAAELIKNKDAEVVKTEK